MKIENIHKNARDVGRRNALLYGLIGLSVCANVVLAIGVVGARQTILVPTLTSELTINGGGVPRDYLERLARDATFVFLNRNPQSEDFFDKQVERLTTPETFQEIKQMMISQRLNRQENRASQVFFPQSFYVAPKELYVEVVGQLDTLNSREVLKSEHKTYGLTFVRRGSLVLLRSFVPVEKNDEKGSQVKPREEPEY